MIENDRKAFTKELQEAKLAEERLAFSTSDAYLSLMNSIQ